MNNKQILILVAIAAGLALVLGSCMIGGVTIEDRLDSFIADLNEPGRADIYLNFHPTLTAYYDALKVGADWNALFPEGDIPYALVGLDTSNPDAVTATIDGSAGFLKPVIFKMAQDGSDWQIDDLRLDGVWEIQ